MKYLNRFTNYPLPILQSAPAERNIVVVGTPLITFTEH
jgi:hypothetical protein